MNQKRWYYEDFQPGMTIDAGSCIVDEDELVAFAERFDPQPFHVDPVAAASSIYGGIIASGWHTCSMMMRLIADNLLNQAASLGSPGVDEVRWLKPVRAGDRLRVTTTVLETRPSRSKPDRGVVVSLWEATNQNAERVLTMKCMVIFARRSSRDEEERERDA